MTRIAKLMIVLGFSFCLLPLPMARSEEFQGFPKGKITSVKTTHNHVKDGVKGILINVGVTIDDRARQILTVRAYVNDKKDQPVKPRYSPEMQMKVDDAITQNFVKNPNIKLDLSKFPNTSPKGTLSAQSDLIGLGVELFLPLDAFPFRDAGRYDLLLWVQVEGDRDFIVDAKGPIDFTFIVEK